MSLADLKGSFIPFPEDKGSYLLDPTSNKEFSKYMVGKSFNEIHSDMNKEGVTDLVIIKILANHCMVERIMKEDQPTLVSAGAFSDQNSQGEYVTRSMTAWTYKDRYPEEWGKICLLLKERNPEELEALKALVS